MLVDLPEEVPPAAALGHVHLVGVGGAGMSGIAGILLSRGLTVSGSDAKDSDVLLALRALGATVAVGHAAEHVEGADTVVVSSAVRPDNPELVRARERGLRILPRAVALGALMVDRRGVAVAGTHGKTTTTSMLTVALQHAGADPSFAIGGNLTESGANAHDGSGDVFVAEADESDGSFLVYRPEVAVVTNVEADHLDNYGTVEAYLAAFDAFAGNVVGTLVVCADDPGARALGERAAADGVRVRTYGTDPAADVVLTDRDGTPEVAVDGAPAIPIPLQVPGRHNVLNALGALAAGTALGWPAADLVSGLRRFTGTRRRFERRGRVGDVTVYDDYAHHPTEVRAALAAARTVAGPGRVVAVFQPHLFSRTRIFAAEFGAALGAADVVVVMDVYAAREDPEPGVSADLVSDRVPLPGDQVLRVRSWTAVPDQVARLVRPGDLVMTIGAGDVTQLGPEILAVLEEAGSGGADR